jgi:ABC-type Fe3+-hydroxamate transport system substrate-binding protein
VSGVREVTDEHGTPVQVPASPRRIVSLVPCVSEALWWMHLADRVVGVTEWCVAPPHAFPDATRVRGTKNPDVSAVVALEPDLVVANDEENRELDVRRLRDAGVPVYVTGPRSVAGAAETYRRLGIVRGAAGAGGGLAQSIERATTIHAHDGPALEVFVPVWREPWMAVGTDTFAADLLRTCGMQVVPAAPRYPRVDLDEIAAEQPDAVLLPDEPYAFGEADRAAFAGWGTRTRLLDGTALTWWGPRTPTALGELTRLRRGIERRLARVRQ